MKNLATLKNMNGAIWQAKNAYLKAVADNLKETGDLRVKSEDYDEDLGYPEGILLSIPDRHFDLVDCVFNAIKVTDKGAIEVHICYFDDQEEEGWMQANELSFNDLDAIIDAIQWPDTITDGEAEKEQEAVKRPAFEDAARDEVESHYNNGDDNDETAARIAYAISKAVVHTHGKGNAARHLLDTIAFYVQGWKNTVLEDEDGE